MSYILHMPTEDELAEISHDELNTCIRLAYQEWQEAFKIGEDAHERKEIFIAFDNELLKRLDRLKKYLVKPH